MDSVMEIQEVTPDSVWILDTLNGNKNAFSHLVQKYQSKFLSMACRILGSRAEAEDVLQDAFLQAYTHLSDFQNRARFSTWLYSIVMNHIRNRLRHNRVLRWTSLDGNPDTDEYKPRDIAENSPSPDVLLDQKLQMEAIHKAVSFFPPQYQSVFILHYFHYLPLKEVASRLNRPLGTVKAYLHRARKLLYKRLARAVPPKKQEAVGVGSSPPALSLA